MQTYEIKYINVFKTNKDGKPYADKKGRPFVRVSIKVAEYGEEYVGGLWFGTDCPWKVGDKVQLIIKDEVYNGKTSKVFEIPKAPTMNNQLLDKVYGNQLLIIEEIKNIKAYMVAKFGTVENPTEATVDYPEEELGEQVL